MTSSSKYDVVGIKFPFAKKCIKQIYARINIKEKIMLTLKIQNPEIETIFLEGFNSNKEMFFDFVKENYNKMVLLNSLEKSIHQAKLQDSQELDEISLDDLITDVKNSTDS